VGEVDGSGGVDHSLLRGDSESVVRDEGVKIYKSPAHHIVPQFLLDSLFRVRAVISTSGSGCRVEFSWILSERRTPAGAPARRSPVWCSVHRLPLQPVTSIELKESPVLKKNLLAISAATIVILTSSAWSQSSPQTPSNSGQSSMNQDIELMRKDIRSEKKQLIAANLQLTDTEAEKFWPIYDQYTAELVKINDAKYAAIKEYVTNYTTLTDDKALSLGRQLLGVDQSVAQLRLKYIPIVNKVISGKKTALFFQLDRRLVMMIDLQMAAELPIIQP
jgi:hypothetical protein